MKKGNIIFAFAMLMIVLLLFISSTLSKDYKEHDIEATSASETKVSFPHIKYLVISNLTDCDLTFEPSNNINLSYYKEHQEKELNQKIIADTLFLSSYQNSETDYRYINIELVIPYNIQLIISNNATLLVRGNLTKNENQSTVHWIVEESVLTFMPSKGSYDKLHYFDNYIINAKRSNISLSGDVHIQTLAINLSDSSSFAQNEENTTSSIDSFTLEIDAHSIIKIPGYLLKEMNK